MTRTLAFGLTVAAVLIAAQVDLRKSEPPIEAIAVGALRAIVSAQATYAAVNGGYATSLKTLATPCAGSARPFISPHMSTDPSVVGDSYEIRLHADVASSSGRLDCHHNRVASAYYAVAIQRKGAAGAARAFAVDHGGIIWSDVSGHVPQPPFGETATMKRLGAAGR